MPKLDSTTPETTAPLPRLFRWRFLLLALYVAGVVVWYCGFGLDTNHPLEPMMPFNELLTFSLATLIFFGMQILFLIGAPHLRWPKPVGKKSMRTTLAVGTLMVALLTCGIIAAAMSLFGVWQPWMDAFTQASDSPIIVVIAFVGIPWLFWLLVFTLIWSGQWVAMFQRLYRLLIAGTILELLITIPIDARVRKKTNCYCGEGTFFAMIVGATMSLWTFGPGLVMLFLARRMQRRAAFGYCVQCGYDLRGLPTGRCPECGTEFERTEKTCAHE